MDKLPFNWTPFKENIGIFGVQGEGKTTRCKFVLDEIPNTPYIIFSPQRPRENYGKYGTIVTDIKKITNKDQFIYAGDYSKKIFIEFVKHVFFNLPNVVVVWDDLHEFISKQYVPTEFETLILSGRNRGISSIFISPFPSAIHNVVLRSCEHIFAYKLGLANDILWMRDNFFGDEAWLLIPKDKRKGYYISEQDYDVIPERSYLYRKRSQPKTVLMIP